MRPKVLFFARDYQSIFFPLLKSDKYESVFVVLNKREKTNVIENGGQIIYCLEEEFDDLEIASFESPYLKFSYGCDRNYSGLKLEERELILKKTISFWRKIFQSHDFSLVVNETVAIEVSEVLAIEASLRGVRYISWMSFPQKNTFYWQIDPFHNSLVGVLDYIEPTDENIAKANDFVKNLSEGLLKPFYLSKKSTRFSFVLFLKSLVALLIEFKLFLKLSKVKRLVSYGTQYRLSIWRIKLFFLSIIYGNRRYDDLSKYSRKEIIFYPLHYEPEAVLFYMAYFFDDQLNIIENTLKCLNENQILLVKEHPQQPGTLIQNKFKKIKERYPNLVLMKAEKNSAEILNRCTTIITLGSTAGFEALALKKKVINLGKVFYDAFEGVNNCKSFDEVYDLMRGKKAFNTSDNFEIFVAKMLQYIKEGNPFPHKDLYSPKNINSIRKAIEDEIDKKN
jgi:hypothetical protein